VSHTSASPGCRVLRGLQPGDCKQKRNKHPARHVSGLASCQWRTETKTFSQKLSILIPSGAVKIADKTFTLLLSFLFSITFTLTSFRFVLVCFISLISVFAVSGSLLQPLGIPLAQFCFFFFFNFLFRDPVPACDFTCKQRESPDAHRVTQALLGHRLWA